MSPSNPSSNPSSAEAAALNAAIDASREAPEPRFALVARCTNQNGKRAMQVFESGTAIWDGTTQVIVPAEQRSALLQTIRNAGFASMADRYGGKRESSAGEAALKVRCLVRLDVGGVSKTSVQLLDGEQSPLVEGLANALLDQVEPLLADGLTPRDLTDGLEKARTGALRPEVFELRFVQIPPQRSETGFIFNIREGVTSMKDYAPGREVGAPARRPSEGERIAELASALLKAEVSTLPINLQADHQIELSVRVLGHERTVLARRFSREPTVEQRAAQPRFDALLAEVRALANASR